MELSLKSKYKSQEILNRRQEIIEKEKLHIKDIINREDFQRLYDKYGNGIDEKDFAYTFLDIDDKKYASINVGNNVSILGRQYVSDEKFESIRAKLIELYGLKTISYNKAIEFHEKFGQELSFKLFSEEVLGIDERTLKSRNLKRYPDREIPVNFDIKPGEFAILHPTKDEMPMYVLNPEYIAKLRKKVVYEDGLQIWQSIDYAKFNELYDKYGKDMTETAFAQEVLDISARALDRMKGSKKSSTVILQNLEISEYLENLRDKIVIINKLEGGQLLEYDKLQEFHRKYGSEFLERDFAVRVLEVDGENYRYLASGINNSITILKSRETNFELLRDRLVREMNLHYDDMMDYEMFTNWHQKYAPNMREVVFAERVLNVTEENFKEVKHRNGRARILLNIKLPSKEEIDEIRRRVVRENKIHINDKIDYRQLKELHSRYGGVMSIEMFAVDVLLISQPKIRVLRREYEEKKDIKDAKLKKALVLYNYEIPLEEIEELKNTIRTKENLASPRMMSKEKIYELYDKYGGIMSFNMFLRGILGVSNKNFEKLRVGKHKETLVYVREKLNHLETLKVIKLLANNFSEDEIAMEMDLPVSFLRNSIKELSKTKGFSDKVLYERVKVLSEENVSVPQIAMQLDISQDDVKQMLDRHKKERTKKYERLRQEERDKKAREKIEAKKILVKSLAEKAVDKYILSSRNIKNVRAYIFDCRQDFEEGKLPKSELDFLSECMIFIQCNCREIELFSRMCIHFNEYNRASLFIAENIDNEGISSEEKKKLVALQSSINYAIRKEEALKKIRAGNADASQIAKETGILEVDVLKLKRIMEESKASMMGKKDAKVDENPLIV